MPEDEQPPRFAATCRFCDAIVLPEFREFERSELHALRIHILECAGRVEEALGGLLRHFGVHTVQ